ncbi:MAG: DUF1643 domain-containing protein [Chloroflexi bacterium]|nr:DUF1643 domain-containing protein [Chloroflexota bacterium]MDA1239293.1 DUF1643 domain-containing protein [Chloroflexota bacterium]
MDEIDRRATFSRDRRYRYSLSRRWGPGPVVAWVMLNPSTADAYRDDATIRRCIALSRSWGFGALEVVNLCAHRATDPRALLEAADPVGRRNNHAIRRALRRADAVVAAWGVPPRALRGRVEAVRWLLPPSVACLGVTTGGQPRHPLYVRADACLVPLDSLTQRSASPTMAA